MSLLAVLIFSYAAMTQMYSVRPDIVTLTIGLYSHVAANICSGAQICTVVLAILPSGPLWQCVTVACTVVYFVVVCTRL